MIIDQLQVIEADLIEVRRHLSHMLKAMRDQQWDLKPVLSADMAAIRETLDLVDLRVVTIRMPFVRE